MRKIADAAELVGDAEVSADAFGVADMQVSRSVRAENGCGCADISFRHVFLDDVADEIGWGGGQRIFDVRIAHLSCAG